MEFCTDQHGSRFIQLKLETSTGSDTAAVFEEVRAWHFAAAADPPAALVGALLSHVINH